MRIDLTLKVKKEKWSEIFKNERMTALGHLGTHFDVMNKVFPLDNVKQTGRIIDVSHIKSRDISIKDIGGIEINENDFIIFYTGFLNFTGYGTKEYFAEHPQLSMELINFLIEKKVSMIGIDTAGIRRGAGHTKTDQFCADHGVFIIENLDNLALLLNKACGNPFTVYTFPVNFEGITGLPCRVVAEI